MKKYHTFPILLLYIMVCLFPLSLPVGAAQKLDGIVAVVGDSIILESELEAYSLLKMNEQKIRPDQVNMDSLKHLYLQELVDGKVLLVHAEDDSNIVIRADEIDDALNRQISGILQSNGFSLDDLARELEKSHGLSLTQFRSQMRRNIREQLLKQKVQQRYVGAADVTRKEVEQFFEEYRDSLPTAGRSANVSKLTIDIAPSDSVRQAAYEKIMAIKERIDKGEEFIALTRFSDGPNAANGGDLGYIGKGTLSELKFEETAFSLTPGEVSDVFETRLGFHLILVEDKRDGKVKIRQILSRVSAPEEHIAQVKARLDSIRTSCSSREEFEQAVTSFSTDTLTSSRKGAMGWVSFYALPAPVARAIDTLSPGDISPPILEENAYSLYRLNDYAEDRSYTLEDDWDLLEEQARNISSQQRLLDLVKKWREETYIDIRI